MKRLLVLAAAVALSLIAQWGLSLGKEPVLFLSGLAAGAGVILAPWALRSARTSWSTPEPALAVGSFIPVSRTWLYAQLVLAGALFLGALVLYRVESSPRLVTWVWALSTAPFLLAFVPRGFRWAFRLSPRGAVELGAVALVLLLALSLRLFSLTDIPSHVHGDEAEIGLGARATFQGQRSFFSTGWYDYPQLTFAMAAPAMALAGDTLFGLRLTSVVLGTLSLLFFYLLTRELFGWRVAWLATLLLAVSYVHIHTSRIGEHYVQAVFFQTLTTFLFLRGLKTRNLWYFAAGGLAIGAGMEIYYAYRIVPVILMAFLGYLALFHRSWIKANLGGLAVLVAGALVFLGPMTLLFVDHPESFLSRTKEVLIFNEGSRRHFYGQYGNLGLWDFVALQVGKTLLSFNLIQDTSTQYAFRMPILDFWTGALFIPGIAYATYHWRRWNCFLCLAWFWLIVVTAGMLTVDPPFLPRLVGLFPVLMVFPALLLDGFWQQATEVVKARPLVVAAPVVASLLLLAGYSNVQRYFGPYARQEIPVPPYTAIASFLSTLPSDHYSYLLAVCYPMLFDYGTIRFLAPQARGRHVFDINDPNAMPPLGVPLSKTAFLLIPCDTDKLPLLQQRYPGGEEHRYMDAQGRLLFAAYDFP